MTWGEVVSLTQHAAEQRGGRAYVRPGVASLNPANEDAARIVIRDAGPDGVEIEAGWTIHLIESTDRDDGPDGAPPAFLRTVEAIMNGRVEEYAIVNPADGTWTEVRWRVLPADDSSGSADFGWGPHGVAPPPGPSFTRRLPAWAHAGAPS